MNALLYALVGDLGDDMDCNYTATAKLKYRPQLRAVLAIFISAIVLFAFVVMVASCKNWQLEIIYFACCRHAVFLDLTLSVSIVGCNTLVVAWKR